MCVCVVECRTDLFIKLALPANLLGVPYSPVQTSNDPRNLSWGFNYEGRGVSGARGSGVWYRQNTYQSNGRINITVKYHTYDV